MARARKASTLPSLPGSQQQKAIPPQAPAGKQQARPGAARPPIWTLLAHPVSIKATWENPECEARFEVGQARYKQPHKLGPSLSVPIWPARSWPSSSPSCWRRADSWCRRPAGIHGCSSRSASCTVSSSLPAQHRSQERYRAVQKGGSMCGLLPSGASLFSLGEGRA